MKLFTCILSAFLAQNLFGGQFTENAFVLGRILWKGGRTFSVAIAGKYAYFGGPGELVALDISTPSSPVAVAKARVPGTVEGLSVRNNLVFVAAGGAGLWVFQLVNGTLKELGHYEGGYHVWDVATSGCYAYLAAHDRGLRIIEVSNRKLPREVGWLETPGFALGVAVAGKNVFLVDGIALRIVGLSREQVPTLVGFSHPIEPSFKVAVSGNYAYVAAYDGGVRIVDVSNPKSPKEVASYDTPGQALSVAVQGRYLYVADGQSGLRIIDVGDPRKPAEVGFVETPGYAEDVAVSGSLVLVADTEDLRIIDASDPRNPHELSSFDPRREISLHPFVGAHLSLEGPGTHDS